MTGKKTFGSGDINLAAALVTVGIPLDKDRPVELIARDNGKQYARFHLGELSACGKFCVYDLSTAWSRPAVFQREKPDHPFSVLMEFITSRPKGCVRREDWISHAAAFLGLKMDSALAIHADIKRACRRNPENKVSYVLAFVRNRFDLLDGSKKMAKEGDFRTMQERSSSVLMMHAKTTPRIRDYLFSHIR